MDLRSPAPTLQRRVSDWRVHGCRELFGVPVNRMPDQCKNVGGWCCNAQTPIIIGVAGSGFDLTSLEDSVRFDIANTGAKPLVSWTAAQSTNAWLALDRNGNGTLIAEPNYSGMPPRSPILHLGNRKRIPRPRSILPRMESALAQGALAQSLGSLRSRTFRHGAHRAGRDAAVYQQRLSCDVAA